MDIFPEGEPLPEEARDILARALDGLETPQAPPPDDVIDLIAPDLVATLGWTFDQARKGMEWPQLGPSTNKIPSLWPSTWPKKFSSGSTILS